jgi:hypothetical protein
MIGGEARVIGTRILGVDMTFFKFKDLSRNPRSSSAAMLGRAFLSLIFRAQTGRTASLLPTIVRLVPT